MIPTIKYEKEFNDLLNEISEKLKDIVKMKNVIAYYWESSMYAEKLLKYCYGNEPITLLIDIRKVAEKLEMYIEEVNISDFLNENVRRSNHKIAQLSVQNNLISGEREVIIYVDKYIPISSKRYAIANEIAQYILHINDRKIYENYFVMPMCPVKADELIADIFSIFLLIPMRKFLDEFCQYVEYRSAEQKIPISTEEWIKYLAERAGVSEYYVAYGYQYLRNIAYWIYQAWAEDPEKLKEAKITQTEAKKIKNWISEKDFHKLKYLIYQNE